jgi:predicted amidophosphoribosyltransferase
MLLLPARCGACRRRGPSPCPPCREHLPAAPTLVAPPPLAALVALLAYEDGARPLVAGLKVRHNRAAQRWLAGGLALLLPEGVDLITWAPTSPSRVAARGADHARLLAEAVAGAAGLRAHATLDRLPGPPQTGRSRSERLASGPSFTARYDLTGLTVAVIDDVTTTGATLAAAGRAVVAAGAAAAIGVAAAATPPATGTKAAGPAERKGRPPRGC